MGLGLCLIHWEGGYQESGRLMFDKLSIRNKLIVLLLLSSALGLLGSLGVVLYSTFKAEKETSLQALHQVAGIISENMQAALAFQDAQSANNILESLKTNPHILLARVEEENGSLLAEYRALNNADDLVKQKPGLLSEVGAWVRHGKPGQPDQIGQMEKSYHFVIHPIEFDGNAIGNLTIISDNRAMYGKMQKIVLMQIGATLLILLALFWLSFRLQFLFTRPIYELLDAMRNIGKSKNYKTILVSKRWDEFGDLYLGFNAMLAEINARDEMLSRLATTDALTQLPNRYFALEAMETMVARSQRTREPLGIIMLDVDYFKNINDSFGHEIGDCVLQEVGKILQSCARPYDLAARWGGEEFLILCDNADMETTTAVAERIRASVSEHEFCPEQKSRLQITLSAGVYSQVPQSDDQQIMLSKADKALYRAKKQGRNRVEVET